VPASKGRVGKEEEKNEWERERERGGEVRSGKEGVWIRQWRGGREKARRRARVGALLFPL